jgi:glucan phosphorylase
MDRQPVLAETPRQHLQHPACIALAGKAHDKIIRIPNEEGTAAQTLLPEALEKWTVELFELVLPRQLEIIYEINRRFLKDVRTRYPGDGARVQRVSLIEEAPVRQVRMAHLAIVGTHSTNGVAAIHSALLRTRLVKNFADMFPERFNNKTNGVTPRRWLLHTNPHLARLITAAIGDGWITDLTLWASSSPWRRTRPSAPISARPRGTEKCALPTGSRPIRAR